MRRAQDLAPDNTRMLVSLVGVHLPCGEPAQARRLLDEVERRPDATGSGVYIAMVYTFLGEADSAFSWLDRAHWGMETRMELRVSGRLKPLRADPRYRRLLDRMGLPATGIGGRVLDPAMHGGRCAKTRIESRPAVTTVATTAPSLAGAGRRATCVSA